MTTTDHDLPELVNALNEKMTALREKMNELGSFIDEAVDTFVALSVVMPDSGPAGLASLSFSPTPEQVRAAVALMVNGSMINALPEQINDLRENAAKAAAERHGID